MAQRWRKKFAAIVGSLLVLAGATQTGVVIGQAQLIKLLTPSGGVSATATFADNIPFVGQVEASGSTLKTTNDETGKAGAKYAAACIPNPLSTGSGSINLEAGSGLLLDLMYHNVSNPNAVGGDIAFVNDCLDDGTGTLVPLIDNTCTATGCYNYTTTSAAWQGAGRKWIKFGLRGAPNANFSGYITGHVRDIIGE